jgi:hypothetical protein
MVLTLGTDLEVFFEDAGLENLGAAGTLDPEAFGHLGGALSRCFNAGRL